MQIYRNVPNVLHALQIKSKLRDTLTNFQKHFFPNDKCKRWKLQYFIIMGIFILEPCQILWNYVQAGIVVTKTSSTKLLVMFGVL